MFTAQRGISAGNGLTGALLTRNPNLSSPQRLDRSQAVTCDQNHEYIAEQSSFDHGLMDKFVQDTGNSATVASCTGINNGTSPNYAVMDSYDGNTVTAMWNYAQSFAMSDNNFETGFGPSTPGVFNLVAANTFGATCGTANALYGAVAPCPTTTGAAGPAAAQGPGTVYSDNDPHYDVCSKGSTIAMGGTNIGDSLDAAGVSWGWFEGGFGSPGYVPGQPSTYNASTVCTGTHKNIAGSVQTDYSAHQQPFQYYPQTANPAHLPPTSIAAIGHQDQADHQYDLADFWAAANAGNMPAVSFLKAPRYQDGHAGYSDPLDEQHFLGSPSAVPSGQQARCGFGALLPLLVISPFARENAIYSGLTDQSSIIRFVEDNWGLPRLGGGAVEADAGQLNGLFDFRQRSDEQCKLILDPNTGQPREQR